MKQILISLALLFFVIHVASAHVTVKPSQTAVGAWENFTVAVPTEKEVPTVGVRLLVPDGLLYVTPTVKPGWKIQTKQEGSGEMAKITEIIWSGGMIPEGRRDDFTFSAKIPEEERFLVWKVIQTYQDGSAVAWDADPSTEDSATQGPYSRTEVVGDLTSASPKGGGKDGIDWDLILGGMAFLIACVALYRTR